MYNFFFHFAIPSHKPENEKQKQEEIPNKPLRYISAAMTSSQSNCVNSAYTRGSQKVPGNVV
jgi:hypothetical protein